MNPQLKKFAVTGLSLLLLGTLSGCFKSDEERTADKKAEQQAYEQALQDFRDNLAPGCTFRVISPSQHLPDLSRTHLKVSIYQTSCDLEDAGTQDCTYTVQKSDGGFQISCTYRPAN